MAELVLKPIGYFRSPQKHPYEAGRQPDAAHSPGWIELEKQNNFEQALIGLEGFTHVWLIFQFHHNENWKPMVKPPRGTSQKQGVFATRSPYRPNPIGMSVVRLEKIDGLKVYVLEADLLDGTPILDIKPYLSYVDSKPEASLGWISDGAAYELRWSEQALIQKQWLEQEGLGQMAAFLKHQLEFDPTNEKEKRISSQGSLYTIAYRTWRIEFEISEETILIQRIFSGYSEGDLLEVPDKYADKDLHRRFRARFSS